MSVVDPIVERLRPVPPERSVLDKLVDRDIAHGTDAKVTEWRRSLALAEGRIAVAKSSLRTAQTAENERELSDATGAATYCREWLRDHR